MIFSPLTYDLRSRILGRKRKQARAAFEPFARLVQYVLRAMPLIFTFGPISILRAVPVVVGQGVNSFQFLRRGPTPVAC